MSEWRHFNDFEQHSLLYTFVHEMPLFFKLLIILIATYIAIMIIKSVRNGLSNNANPLLKANCTAVTKRTEVTKGSSDSISSTSYFVTFKFEDGEHKELCVTEQEYGFILEGDIGVLTYKGTNLKTF